MVPSELGCSGCMQQAWTSNDPVLSLARRKPSETMLASVQRPWVRTRGWDQRTTCGSGRGVHSRELPPDGGFGAPGCLGLNGRLHLLHATHLWMHTSARCPLQSGMKGPGIMQWRLTSPLMCEVRDAGGLWRTCLCMHACNWGVSLEIPPSGVYLAGW